ncbi:MAG: hypothetical protein SGJ05_03160 [bacterium]|nr:hypothetical protein [bacterium]
MSRVFSIAKPLHWTPVQKGFAIALVLAVVVSLSGLLVVRPYSGPEFASASNPLHYYYMAEHPIGSFHVAPFCWRIGLPWLVQSTGLPTV